MPDEKTFFVVVGVDEPAGDPVCSVAADFARVGVEDVDSVHFDADLAVFLGDQGDIRFAEDDEQVSFAGILEVVGHVQVGIHAGFEDGESAEFAEFGRMRLVVEGTGDQDVEPRLGRLASGGGEVQSLDGSEFGTDEDGSPFFGFSFQIPAFGTDQIARPRGERRERDFVFLVSLLDSGGPQVFQDHLGKALLWFAVSTRFGQRIDQVVVFIDSQSPMGRQAFDGERPGDPDLFLVFVRFVVEVFKLGLGGDRGINLLLPGNPSLPPLGMDFFGCVRPFGVGLTRDLPFFERFFDGRVQLFK